MATAPRTGTARPPIHSDQPALMRSAATPRSYLATGQAAFPGFDDWAHHARSLSRRRWTSRVAQISLPDLRSS